MFFAILVSWMTGIAAVTTGVITIFITLLSYVFGDKVAKNVGKIANKKIDAQENLFIVE